MSLDSNFKLEAIQFEKDDDTNFHMEFIAGLANMRARNYSLQAKYVMVHLLVCHAPRVTWPCKAGRFAVYDLQEAGTMVLS